MDNAARIRAALMVLVRGKPYGVSDIDSRTIAWCGASCHRRPENGLLDRGIGSIGRRNHIPWPKQCAEVTQRGAFGRLAVALA